MVVEWAVARGLAARQEVVRQEVVRQEVVRQEVVRQEVVRQEVVRQEVVVVAPDCLLAAPHLRNQIRLDPSNCPNCCCYCYSNYSDCCCSNCFLRSSHSGCWNFRPIVLERSSPQLLGRRHLPRLLH
jgi:hypothetical protein